MQNLSEEIPTDYRDHPEFFQKLHVITASRILYLVGNFYRTVKYVHPENICIILFSVHKTFTENILRISRPSESVENFNAEVVFNRNFIDGSVKLSGIGFFVSFGNPLRAFYRRPRYGTLIKGLKKQYLKQPEKQKNHKCKSYEIHPDLEFQRNTAVYTFNSFRQLQTYIPFLSESQ